MRALTRLPKLLVRLVRFPGILAAVLFGSVVLAMTVAATPLFLSSAGNAALAQNVSRSTATFAGLSVSVRSPAEPDSFAFRSRLLDEALQGIGGLGSATVTLTGSEATMCAAGCRTPSVVRLISKTGFASHLVVRRRASGPGMWIADLTAGQLGVGPGDRVAITLGERTASVRVAGVYAYLPNQLPSPFWAAQGSLIYRAPNSDRQPPAFALTEPLPFLALEQDLRDEPEYRWDFPLADPRIGREAAAVLSSRLERVSAELADPSTQLGGSFYGADGSAGLPGLLKAADATETALAAPITSISVAGWILALVLLGLAGLFALRRRSVEVRLLMARGVGPVRLGLGGVVEALLPAAIGVGGGWLFGTALVAVLGPSAVVDAQARSEALRDGGWALAGALALLGIVVAVAARREQATQPARTSSRRAGRAPWDIVLMLLAGAALYELLGRGSPIVGGTAGGAPRIDRLLLLFPLLFIAGLAGFGARFLRRVLPKLRTAGRSWPTPVYLAGRRLAAAPGTVLLLTTWSVVGIGLLAYAGILVSSVRATASAKAEVFTGSDVAVVLPPNARVPAHLPFEWTRVARVQGVAQVVPAGGDVDLLGVDPQRFGSTAFWDGSFSPMSLSGLMDALSARPPGRIPAVAVGLGLGSRAEIGIASYRFPIELVGTAKAFPGMVAGRPLIVLPSDLLELWLTRQGTTLGSVLGIEEVWARGNPGAVLAGLRKAGLPAESVQVAQRVAVTPAFLALSWTFGFLEALGVLAGSIVLVGLLLYLQAGQRSRAVSYALARRMGLDRRAHRQAVAIEIVVMLLTSFVAAAALGIVGSWLVHGSLDLLPTLPPPPLLRIPAGLFVVAFALVSLLAVGGAWQVQRHADRANVGELMRAGG